MNNAEKQARKLYEDNKILAGWTLNSLALSKICKQQDRLYLVIHERADRRMN